MADPNKAVKKYVLDPFNIKEKYFSGSKKKRAPAKAVSPIKDDAAKRRFQQRKRVASSVTNQQGDSLASQTDDYLKG